MARRAARAGDRLRPRRRSRHRVVGALIASLLFPRLGIRLGSGIVAAIVSATLGAVILLLLRGVAAGAGVGDRRLGTRCGEGENGGQPMRYFFDVHNGNELTRDEVGMELEGINQARDEAAEALAEIASASRDPNPRDFAIEVRDELGQLILKAAISFAVQTVAA